MGYTHYFTAKKHTTKQWSEFVEVSKKLLANLPKGIEIAGGDGTGEPEMDDSVVVFNGKDELSHETLFIDTNSLEWDFCKTNRKPYDLLVTSCLIAAYRILGYSISSDGFDGTTCKDWQEGIDHYNKVVEPTELVTQEELINQRD